MNKIADVGSREDILRRFPGPVILFPSGTRWVSLIIAAAGLTIVSAISIFFGSPIIGLFGSIVFAAMTLIGISVLLPGSNSLRLDRESFICTRFYRAKAYPWSEVSDFGVWIGRRGNLVVFQMAKPRLTALEKINQAISGRNGFLPDTYGWQPEDLVQLMIEWRKLATREIRQNAGQQYTEFPVAVRGRLGSSRNS